MCTLESRMPHSLFWGCVTSLLTGGDRKGHRYCPSVEWRNRVCLVLRWEKKCHPTLIFFVALKDDTRAGCQAGISIGVEETSPALLCDWDCVVAGWNSLMLLLLLHRDVSVPDCADSHLRKHDTPTQRTVALFPSPSIFGKCLVSFSCLWLAWC